jgi:hypothetical protein
MMGISAGPDMVQDGLVLLVDATNPVSYPGNGTTWFDVSGNNANISLINGPTYVSQGMQSYFSFDGNDDYGSTTVAVPDSNPGDRCHFDAWCYTSMKNVSMLMSWGNQKHDIFIASNGIGFNSYNSDVFGVSITPLTNVWMHFAVNFYRNDYTQGTIFVNGVRQNLTYFSSNMNAGNVVFGGGQMRIGAGGDGYYGVWRFNNVKVYNRNLSDFEIKQNYNSLKSRFNL